MKRFGDRSEFFLADFKRVIDTGFELLNTIRLYIETKARVVFREFHGQWQTNISQANHANVDFVYIEHRFVLLTEPELNRFTAAVSSNTIIGHARFIDVSDSFFASREKSGLRKTFHSVTMISALAESSAASGESTKVRSSRAP